MNFFDLEDTKKSYLKVFIFGLIIGIITEITNLLPNDGVIGWSGMAGTFGFWIFTTTFVIYFSRSNKGATINTFLYLIGMCISYYILDGFVVLFTPNLIRSGFLDFDKLFFWGGASIICGIIGYALYFWNKDKWYSSALYSLPVAGMLIDTINNCMKFYYSNTQLLQSIFDVVFLLIMLIFFLIKSKNKFIYLLILVLTFSIGYFGDLFPKSHNLTTRSTIECTLNNEVETYKVEVRDDGKVLTNEGNEKILNEIKMDGKTTPEIVHALQDYYENLGGTCTTK